MKARSLWRQMQTIASFRGWPPRWAALARSDGTGGH